MLRQEMIPWALENLYLGDDLLELGPGPGLATDVLRTKVTRLTALECDPVLAADLRNRMRPTNVRVHEGDATAMPFPERTFTAVVCFTMLHHVPSPVLQDRLFAEAFRVLRPGGAFAGTDSRVSLPFRLIHWADTMVPVDPDILEKRLRAAGFTDIAVSAGRRTFRFRARRAAL